MDAALNHVEELPNVLVVDDDPRIRAVVRRVLERSGAFGEIHEADDAAEGVFLARRFPPDVVLLDYLLPALDGASANTYFRESVPQARIVAFSGMLSWTPTWADAYISKDEIKDLAPKLSRLLSR